MKRSITAPTPLVLLLLLGALSVGLAACDFTHVNEGANTPLATLLADLEAADSQEEAQDAVRALLNKTGLAQEERSGFQKVDEDVVRDLAEEHLAYKQGTRAAAAVETVFDRVVQLRADVERIHQEQDLKVGGTEVAPIRAGIREITEVFTATARGALQHPEEAAHALMVAVVAEDGQLPAQITPLAPQRALGPVQQFLFADWVHRQGPRVFPYHDHTITPSVNDDPSANACCAGGGKFTTLTLEYQGDTQAHVRIDVEGSGNGKGNGGAQAVQGAFEALVQPGETFTVFGPAERGPSGFDGTLGNEIRFLVKPQGASSYTALRSSPDRETLHTSCSQAVFPGDLYGYDPSDSSQERLFLVVFLTTQESSSIPDACTDFTCATVCVDNFNTCLSNESKTRAECEQTYAECNSNCHDQGGAG